jgi:hypothetical protein
MPNGLSGFEINSELQQAKRRRRNQSLDHHLGLMPNSRQQKPTSLVNETADVIKI